MSPGATLTLVPPAALLERADLAEAFDEPRAGQESAGGAAAALHM